MSDSLQPHGLHTPWNSPGQNTGVGTCSLLQGILQIQESNPGLPHCRQILYQLSYQGNPRTLEWVAYPFPGRSSWPRNRTRVSCTAGGFFTNLSEKPHFLVNFQTKCYELKSSKVVTVYMHKPWPRDSEGTFSQAWDTLSTAEFTLPVPLSPLQPPALSFLQQI